MNIEDGISIAEMKVQGRTRYVIKYEPFLVEEMTELMKNSLTPAVLEMYKERLKAKFAIEMFKEALKKHDSTKRYLFGTEIHVSPYVPENITIVHPKLFQKLCERFGNYMYW